ncbi:hypothetical protein AB0J25_30050, partial [Streptomyces sp. NPDC049910]|uniref:hypothetical protein n=1 Tax=Streptomyces sp. NPDC049910 TaxID=3155278 RepID=UPI003448E592
MSSGFCVAVITETPTAGAAELEPKPKAEALTAALKPYGVATEQISRRIDGKVVNKRGIKREDIATAITERNNKRGRRRERKGRRRAPFPEGVRTIA